LLFPADLKLAVARFSAAFQGGSPKRANTTGDGMAERGELEIGGNVF
jgi:hypothetical protein